MENGNSQWTWEYSYKDNFPIHWSNTQKHYQSFPPPKGLRKLSPDDLHRKWRVKSHADEKLSSAVMKIAPSVVSVAVFYGVQRILDCSGFIIRSHDPNGKATIITSAKVMRYPGKRDDYYIAVRLANGKILLAVEDYVDYYHNIATLKVDSDDNLKPLELYLSPLETVGGAFEIVEGVVIALGRDFYTCKLIESSGFIRRDYPYFGCELLLSSTCIGSQDREGGPLITRMGHVRGVNFFDGSKFVHPLPTTVIRSCLDKWNSSRIVIRPWFGLTVIDIAQLPHDELETIATYGDSTAVVKAVMVYEGSPADKVGVHPGDTVVALKKSLSRITIHSASQYAQELSSISGELSAYCPDKTPPDIRVSVRGYDSHISKIVHAENLQVNDRRFCSSWLRDDRTDWHTSPLIGSQILESDEAREYGLKTNIVLTGTACEGIWDNETENTT